MRIWVLATIALLLAGCSERHFVPGSPMAKAFGHNRSYADIAADDCARQYGFRRDGDEHRRCAYELSMLRQQQDAARIQGSAIMFRAGADLMNQAPAYSPSPFRTYAIDGRTYRCSTIGTATTCN
jgi:hypothetical protein